MTDVRDITRVLIALKRVCIFKWKLQKTQKVHHEILHRRFVDCCCKLFFKSVFFCEKKFIVEVKSERNFLINFIFTFARPQPNTSSRTVTTWTSLARNALPNSRSQPHSSPNTRSASSRLKESPRAICVASLCVLVFSTTRRASWSKNTWSKLDVATRSVKASQAASTSPEPTPACGPTVDSCASTRAASCQKDTKLPFTQFLLLHFSPL